MSNPFNFGELLKKQLSEQIAKDDKKNPGLQAIWDAIFEENEGKDNKQKSNKSEKEDDQEKYAKSKNSENITKENYKTRLEMLLNLNADARSYVDDGKYHEAYGILSSQIRLGEDGNFANVEMKFYKVLISTGRHGAADRAKDRFFSILHDNLHTTPKECELLGEKYLSQHEYIKAILLYQAGEAMYLPTFVETDNLRHCLEGCLLGLKLATAKLVKVRPDLRSMVTREIIPGMRRLYNKIRNLVVSKSKSSIIEHSQCLHHIETTELKAENPLIREKTLREALNLMETGLGEEVWKNKMYSCHLNNLAVTCMSLNRPAEAIDIFNDAIKARKLSEGYVSEIERDLDMEMSKRGLEKAKEILEYINHHQQQQQQQSQEIASVTTTSTAAADAVNETITESVTTTVTTTSQVKCSTDETHKSS